MKKTLVAIAALTLVGAVSAQSSVTLYGRIDAAIGSQKTTTAGVTVADKGVQILAGIHTGNRWGMKGSEDLGGGMKAIFQLESGFSVDTGASAQGGLLFGRQAYVGLSGGFGTLTVGRQYDMLDNAYGMYDAFGYSGYGAMNYVFNRGTGGDVIGRQNNSVAYSSPNMGGFSVSGMWAPGEDKVPGVSSAGQNYGLMANYANGPIGVGAVWQSNKVGGVGTKATTNYLLGGSYDLGAAKLYGQYEGTNNKGANSKDNGWQLGAVIPLGGPSLMVSYASEKTKTAGVKVSDGKALSLMAQYPLSKRTYVYAAYLGGENDPVGPGNTTKQRNYGLGLVHNF